MIRLCDDPAAQVLVSFGCLLGGTGLVLPGRSRRPRRGRLREGGLRAHSRARTRGTGHRGTVGTVPLAGAVVAAAISGAGRKRWASKGRSGAALASRWPRWAATMHRGSGITDASPLCRPPGLQPPRHSASTIDRRRAAPRPGDRPARLPRTHPQPYAPNRSPPDTHRRTGSGARASRPRRPSSEAERRRAGGGRSPLRLSVRVVHHSRSVPIERRPSSALMKASTSGRDGAPGPHPATARRSRTTGGPSHTPAQAEKEGPAYSSRAEPLQRRQSEAHPDPWALSAAARAASRSTLIPPYIALRRLYRPSAARSPPRSRPGPAGGRRTAPRASRRRGGWSRVAAAIRRRDPSTMLVNL